MRPVTGFVLSTGKKSGLKIKLESGRIIKLPYNKNIQVGQKILVRYNFTTNKVTGIINSYKEENIPETTKRKRGGNDNDPEDPEIMEILLAS